MRYVLFATAGHTDHGKTTLVKKLTGIDTDRLPEEKKRGLTVDIGFAFLDFPQDNLRLELIDVPGHERYIRNAVAGLCCVSGVLLVVDASEGVMPQTRELLRIAKSFGIRRGVVALTKVDICDKSLLELSLREVEDLLKENTLSLPIVKVSAVTGEGLGELKEELRKQANEAFEDRSKKPLRIVVDSAFIVKGWGTVVRGNCTQGKVKKGERVVIEPIGKTTRVRNIQNHGRFVSQIWSESRVALNLPDLDPKEVRRGFWVLKEGTYTKTNRLLGQSQEGVPVGKRLHLFFGMKLVEGIFSKVGEDVFLLKLKEEVVAYRGDRALVLKSSGEVVGSFEVLHPAPKRLSKKFIRENLHLLKDRYEEYLLRELLGEGLSQDLFLKLTAEHLKPENLKEAVKVGSRFFHREYLQRIRNSVEEFIRGELKKGRVGVPKAEVLRRFQLREEILDHLLRNSKEFVAIDDLITDLRKSDIESLPAFKRLKELLRDGIRDEKELLSLGVSEDVIRLAVRRRIVHRLEGPLVASDEFIKKTVEKLRRLGNGFSLREAKEALGLTRKYLIPLLEYLDYLGFTRREGNLRVWKRHGEMDQRM